MQAERHQRVMEILADVLECDTARRQAVLCEECRGDESLRREVERLLSHKISAANFLEEAPVAKVAFTEDEDSRIGERIGPYTIEAEIGRGGMGTVYLAARDDSEYEKRVAIKLIRAGADKVFSSRRFRNERQILADLEHPNIARMIDGGTTADGLPYLVMEYVEGEPVNKYAGEQGLSTADRLKLFRTICSAVEYAHQKRVIHRDIKPGNILVTAEGVPKLLDFGIAKLLNPDSATATDTTGVFQVMTPEYASPEQARGEAVTASTDIYSLGVVLYELLTGQRPYRLKSRRADEIIKAICDQEPERPSTAVSRAEEATPRDDSSGGAVSDAAPRNPESARLRRDLRGDLDNILLTALRKESERRYASVAEFSEDIRRHLEGLPVRARKDTWAYRAAKFFRRNRTYAITTAAVALLCLLLGVFLTLFSVRSKAKESIAVLPFINSNDDANLRYLTDAVTDEMIARLSRRHGLTVPRHDSVFPYQGKLVDPLTAGRALGVQTVLVGNVTTDGTNILITVNLLDVASNKVVWSKQYKAQASELPTVEDEISQDTTRALGFDVSNGPQQLPLRGTTSVEAYNLYLKGDYYWNQRQRPSIEKAIEYFQGAIEIDPKFSLAYTGLANSYSLLGAFRIFPPDETFGKAKPIIATALQLDPNSAEAHNALAMVHWKYDWDWPGADQEFRRAIELNPDYALAHHWYGLFLGEQKRSEEAIAEEQRALQLDPFSISTLGDLAWVYKYARRYREALEQLKKAEELGPPVGDLPTTRVRIYEDAGMVDELMGAMGDASLKEALSEHGMKGYWQRLLQIEMRRPTTWQSYYYRAELFSRIGNKDRAIEQLNLAYQVREQQMSSLKVSSDLDNLRSDPRFKELLQRMNLSD